MVRSPLARLLRLAAPIALGHLANMTMGLVDTLVVSRVSPAALGGVAVGNAIFMTIAVLSIGILLGLDYFVAKSYGARDLEAAESYSVQGLWISFFLSIPGTALILLAPRFLLPFGVAPDVAREATAYLHSVTGSLFPFLLFTALRQSLQAVGIVQSMFWGLLLANGLNLLGNLAWVLGRFGFESYGVAGSGWATTLSRVFLVAWGIFFWLRWRKANLPARSSPQTLRLRMDSLKEILKLGIPAGLHFLLEVGIFALATLLISKLSAVELAAHQITLQIASFSFMIPIGFSAAAATLVGQSIGAGDGEGARRFGWYAIRSIAAINTFSAILIYLFRVPLLHAFSTDPETFRLATLLLLIAVLFQIGDGVQAVAAGALRGMGVTKATLVLNLIGHWGIGLPLGLYLCFVRGWGAQGIWVALAVGLSLVAIGLTWVWSKRSIRI